MHRKWRRVSVGGFAILLSLANGACNDEPAGCDGESCEPLSDGGSDVGADDAAADVTEAGSDAKRLIAECLGQPETDCASCCSKTFEAERLRFYETLIGCVCGPTGACSAACADNDFCATPDTGPSSTCEPCLLDQLKDGAPCASEVAQCEADATCSPYVSCLSACPAPQSS